MSNIKVLDCTLRDGGYINNWNFHYKNIKQIIKNLVNANIDYVECGFLKPIDYVSEKSLFSKTEQLELLINEKNNHTKFALMINYGEYNIDNIPKAKNDTVMFRVAFRKDKHKEALPFCRKLKEKGYKIFINPTQTNTYSTEELLELISNVNQIKPHAFTIVDTNGGMSEKDILNIFNLIDTNLNRDTALGFHSHNSLQMSFSNAQCLMKVCKERELIIDSTVFGMGRGAGNLCTELITQYINNNFDGSYNIVPILKTIDEYINPIFARTPWGYSVPYYLAAINYCHPNYAKYLVDKQSVPVEIINELLQSIPQNKKAIFDKDLIKQIYLDFQNNSVEDKDVIQKLKTMIGNKNILILAPGKSILSEKNKIDEFIKNNNPFIISINFIPDIFNSNLAFITNLKRFDSIDDINIQTVVTSNIKEKSDKCLTINYSKYLNDSEMYDNAALMCFKFLISLGVKNINIAGLDGFKSSVNDNYYNEKYVNGTVKTDKSMMNKIISDEIKSLSKEINIHFLTKTMYV